MRKQLYLLLLFCAVPLFVSAQNIQVSGTVVDEAGETLPGVTVVSDQNKKGTITDANGQFSLTVAKGTGITFSFIGLESQTLVVETEQPLKVVMQESATTLDEVIVVGYGLVKKSDFTGSVASMKNEELMKARPVSLEQGLQGRLAGVNVVRNDGAPGGGISMQIRGTTSFMGGTEPLYVIDGVPLSTNNESQTINFDSDKDVQSRNALAFLDPNDIESIEVLKDGSSIAIYGSRGANGVVMITTKSGKQGQDKLTVSANIMVSKVARLLDVLGASDYARYQNTSFINTETIRSGSYDPVKLPFPGIWKLPDGTQGNEGDPKAEYHKGPDDFENDPHYWQNHIFRTAVTKDANVNYSGGSKGFDYSIGGSYINQQGVVINSGFNRASFKVNVNKEVKPWLKMGTSTLISTATSNMLKTATQNQNNGDEGVIRSALFFPPTYTVDSEVTLGEYSTVANPKQYTEALNKNQNYNIYTSNYANINLGEGFVFRTSLGFNASINRANRYFPTTLSEGRSVHGRADAGANYWESWVWDNLLMFNRTFGEKHNVNATLGTSWETKDYYSNMITVHGFGIDSNNGWLLGEGSDTRPASSDKGNIQLLSYIMRAAYSYESKYMLTVTMRRDAASQFAENHKAAFFPSVGGAWTISREDFMKDITAISNLKLRYSYGTSGNAGIGAYGSLALLTGANYPFGGGVNNGFAPDPYNPGNPNLRWETTYQHDAGIDLSLLNKVDLNVDYYDKRTVDLLQQREQAPSTGMAQVLANIGEVRNRGIEIAVSARLVSTKDFTWTAAVNFSKNINTVVSVGESGEKLFPNQLWNDLRPFVLTDGRPIGQMYGFEEDGIWNSREEIISSKQFQNIYPGYKPGDNDPATEQIIAQRWLGEIRYLDRDTSGTITETDMTYIGDANPDFTYGFSMNFTYKNFDFSFLFDGVYGNDIFNMSSLRFHDLGGTRNTMQEVYNNAWTPEQYGANPKIHYDPSRKMLFSRRFIEDGSYLKLRNVSIGYNFVKPFTGVSSLRVFATGNNLLTFTKYSGYDPEVNAFGSNAALRGVDAGGYPQAREFMFGVNLIF